jgi:hypothetical protein
VEKVKPKSEIDTERIFQLCIEELDPFWCAIDFEVRMNGYRSSSPNTRPSFSRELPPLMWKTFIGDAYMDFFKNRERSDCFEVLGKGGCISLAPTFSEVTDELRLEAMEKVGLEHFAPLLTTPDHQLMAKELGQYIPLLVDVYKKQCELRGEKPVFLEDSV